MNMIVISRGFMPNTMPADNNYQQSILGGFSQHGIWNHVGRGQQRDACPELMPVIPNGRSGGLWDIMRSTMPAMTNYSDMSAPVPMDPGYRPV